MATSNNRDCFTECIGKRVRGVLFDAVRSAGANTYTLVFDDGTGLTLAGNGSYWRDSQAEIKKAIVNKRRELDKAQSELRRVLTLAGDRQ